MVVCLKYFYQCLCCMYSTQYFKPNKLYNYVMTGQGLETRTLYDFTLQECSKQKASQKYGNLDLNYLAGNTM